MGVGQEMYEVTWNILSFQKTRKLPESVGQVTNPKEEALPAKTGIISASVKIIH